ncbi:ABC transporter permease [Paenibacillus mucilaginosus]|uniref:DppC n=3 Tax=Paenibacillus mucilaginosus TaxID=61624 RepID=H6NG93_9BACL|nr:ABC transporter permease [Paenibacillus mucilaginosus]AFC32220.1 DppC [Paenibacillus mucilaginosus 3016]AFH64522.1 diguanylate cyclase [Paenibacillus mucilaginosus K02]MCG7214004.1 ABC transporter permease [Paenibacillus mucilaginosus]WDM26004.1 ABC transporter permease [Paenibacillus mucilaginosus]WFA20720.1 ABC transporter permease [Paenibacillus mucilaginosus]
MQTMENNAFQPLSKSSQSQEVIVRPSLSYWKDAWRRLRKNKLAMLGLYTLLSLMVMAILAPFFSSYDYATQTYTIRNQWPSAAHWFGTDDFGRDLWVRVWWGTRISLFIGIVAALIDFVIGILYGGISAYFGGRVDDIMQRVIEIVYSIPFLLITILMIMTIGPSIWTIILAYSITGWVPMARLVRGQILTLKEQEFVLAARTLGASPSRIILRHLIPNALGIIIVQITFVVPNAIFVESFLSFIGLGVRPPLASLGSLLSDGVKSMTIYPYKVLIPTVIFSLILMSFNLLGDGLRDALDPKMRK